MENTSAQPANAATPTSTKAVSPVPAVPHIDPKAALKIETATPSPDEKKVSYGEKTLLGGIVFAILIILSVVGVVYFWTQNSNQVQKSVTVETKK